MRPAYEYRAARADGTLVRGRIAAATSSQAAALLLERGLQPVQVIEASPDSPRARSAARRDLAVVFRSLAALVEAGVPLERAVASTEALAGGALRACLTEARSRLRDGNSLAQALDSEIGAVPSLVLGMLRAGERSGRLGVTLEQVATHLELEADLVARLRHALAYPALLVVAGVASVLVIGTVVVPKFSALLEEAGQELPPATRILLHTSTFITSHWLPLLLSGLIAVWAAASWIRLPRGRLQWHRLLLGFPWINRIRLGLATVRVSRALSGGIEAGMPLLPALELAREAAGDREIAARLGRARERVARGEQLAAALTHERTLTPAAIQLVAVGEGSGRLAPMIGRAGELAARETERALGTLVGVLEPSLVVLLGGFVAFVAAALLQALYGLRPVGQ